MSSNEFYFCLLEHKELVDPINYYNNSKINNSIPDFR